MLFFALFFLPSLLALDISPVKDIRARIFNGEEAELGQFPWQIAILGRSNVHPQFLCGGALISDWWVLTAGHCVQGIISARIYSGTNQISSPNGISQGAEFILHEEFDYLTLNNDIGLIRLNQPVEFDDYTQAIALADTELDAGVNVTITGFGSLFDEDPEPYSDTLNYITVPTINNPDCVVYYGDFVVTAQVVCTRSTNVVKSPCAGDSGAPLVAYNDDVPVHVGIFSFVNGYSCEFFYPAGSTRTASYRDWIRDKTGI